VNVYNESSLNVIAIILLSYKGPTQRRVNLLLRRSDVTNGLELMIENPEEDCDDADDAVAARTVTLKRMSLAFCPIEEGLDIIVVYSQ
jgi:hypothetical protein